MKFSQLIRIVETLLQRDAIRQIVKSKRFSMASYQICKGVYNYEPRLKTILDIGANRGQFAISSSIRFPEAKIFSYEPVPETYLELRRNTSWNPRIECFNFALGDSTGTLDFFQNNYSHVSSALEIDDRNANPNYDKGVKEVIQVPVQVLGSLDLEDKVISPSLLKLDVQGYEKKVISGLGSLIAKIDYILLEVSFVTLYKDQPLFEELNIFLMAKGYEIVAPLNTQIGHDDLIIEMDILYKRK